MEWYEEELDKVVTSLKLGKTIQPTTVRAFLRWFDIYRRTRWNRDFIDKELAKRGLITIPNYKDEWVDIPMTFAFENEGGEENLHSEQPDERDDDTPNHPKDKFGEDPRYKVGKLDAARRGLVYANPNASLEEVKTKMFSNDFSQIPIMQNDYSVKGVVSWKSIGLNTTHSSKSDLASDYMEMASEVSYSSSIFDVIVTIIGRDYVIVRDDQSNKITGIVTAADLCELFEQISKPFLLISEIEINIRNIIENTFQADDLTNFFSEIAGEKGKDTEIRSEKLTFGHYIMILQNADNWKKLGLNLDRSSFCDDLERIRNIRNDVMHFAAEPIKRADLQKIKSMAQMLDLLRTMAR